MAEETIENEEGTMSKGEQFEKDFAAEAEKWKAESRKWEKRAKENSSAAEELAKLKESQLSEVELAQKKAADAEAELERIKAASERNEWNMNVAKSTGVPLDVIAMLGATSEEDLAEKAKAVKDQFEQREKDTVPVVLGAGTNPPAPKSKQGDWIRDAINKR